MAASLRERRRRRAAALPLTLVALTFLLLAACSVGVGEGFVSGSVRVDECRLDQPAFDLMPNFFVAEFVSDPELIDRTATLRHLNMRIQRGSWREVDSDGLFVSVADVNELERSLIGVPIAITDEATAMVHLTLYLGQTCRSGFPDNHWTRSVILPAVSGTITFDAIYAPGLGDPDGEISATFDDVYFTDAAEPDTRQATLSGAFSFVYQRGRPAQRFP